MSTTAPTGVKQGEAVRSTDKYAEKLSPEVLKGMQAFFACVDLGVGIYEIFDIEEALLSHKDVLAAQLEYLKSNPDIAQLFEERYSPTHPSVEELLKLPKDSLGFAYASNLQSAEYSPDFLPKIEVKDDATYYMTRMHQTHDIWHTVSGYGFDDFGGAGLGGFQFGNNRDPLNVVVLASGLLNLIKAKSDYLNVVMAVLLQGYNAGIQAKPFLAQKWEDAWDKPLAEWRAELNVIPLKCKNFQEIVQAA